MTEPKEIDAVFIGLRCTNITRFGTGSWRKTVLQVYSARRIATATGIALGNVPGLRQPELLLMAYYAQQEA